MTFLKTNVSKEKEVQTDYGFSLVTITEGNMNNAEETHYFAVN